MCLFAGSELSFSLYFLVHSALVMFNLMKGNGMYSLRQRENLFRLKQYVKVSVKGFLVCLVSLKCHQIKLNSILRENVQNKCLTGQKKHGTLIFIGISVGEYSIYHMV